MNRCAATLLPRGRELVLVGKNEDSKKGYEPSLMVYKTSIKSMVTVIIIILIFKVFIPCSVFI